MTRLRVDLVRLDEIVHDMAAFEQHLTRTHDAVRSRVADMQATWQGDAAAAQAVAQREWSTALGDVQSALTALRRLSATAHANYAAAIAANRRMWSP